MINKICKIIHPAPNWGTAWQLKKLSPMGSFKAVLSRSRGDSVVLKEALDIALSIDQQRYQAIYNKYHNADPSPGYSKYLDFSAHIARAVYHIHQLNLNRSQPQKILDIGSGAGYFPLACKYYGHDAQGLDMDTIPMYNELKNLVGLSWTPYRIEAYKPFPVFSHKFDTITAFQIMFNRLPTGQLWGIDEWKYFLEDLKANVFKEHGTLYIGFNTIQKHEHHQLQEIIEFMQSLGGILLDDYSMCIKF